MRKLMAIAAVIAVALGVFATGQAPASAHVTGATHGGDGHDSATTSQYHYSITVCDNERDGHYAYAYVQFASGYQDYEDDGGDAGCDTKTWDQPYIYFWICEETKGCNGPYTS